MKKIIFKSLLVIVLVIYYVNCNAQIGINNDNPDSSAILDIQSADRGLLIPRINGFSAIDKIKKAEGLMVYDNFTKAFYFWNGMDWQSINPLKKELQKDTMYANASIQIDTPNTFVGYGTIPLGGIIMWSGNDGTVPDGWALCDGRIINGYRTPDLRGRFIVGYGRDDKDYGSGKSPASIWDNKYNDAGNLSVKNIKDSANTGGSKNVQLDEKNLPKHYHSGGTLFPKIGEFMGPEKSYALSGLSYDGSGNTGSIGGEYTFEEKINPTKYFPQYYFYYKCTVDSKTFYSNDDIVPFQSGNRIQSKTQFTPELGYSKYNYDGFYFYKIESGFIDKEFLSESSDLENLEIKVGDQCITNPQFNPSLQNNPEFNPIVPAYEKFKTNEKWDVKPVDFRPPYYVLAFIMRVR